MKRSEMSRRSESASMFTRLENTTVKVNQDRIRFHAWNQLSNKQAVDQDHTPLGSASKVENYSAGSSLHVKTMSIE